MKKIILTSEGLLVIDAPELPTVKKEILNSKGEVIDKSVEWHEYDQILSQAIKEGVMFKEQKETQKLLYLLDAFGLNVTRGEIGKLYDIPEGYEVEIKEELEIPTYKNGNHMGIKRWTEYAILKPVTKVGNDGFMFDANSTYPKKQLTPMQELIEKTKEWKQSGNSDFDEGWNRAMEQIERDAQSLLPKEKQMVVDACRYGVSCDKEAFERANITDIEEQYYNEKYK